MVFLEKESYNFTTLPGKRRVGFLNFLIKCGGVYLNMLGKEMCPFLVCITEGL